LAVIQSGVVAPRQPAAAAASAVINNNRAIGQHIRNSRSRSHSAAPSDSSNINNRAVGQQRQRAEEAQQRNRAFAHQRRADIDEILDQEEAADQEVCVNQLELSNINYLTILLLINSRMIQRYVFHDGKIGDILQDKIIPLMQITLFQKLLAGDLILIMHVTVICLLHILENITWEK
jgi:hypothetical protein